VEEEKAGAEPTSSRPIPGKAGKVLTPVFASWAEVFLARRATDHHRALDKSDDEDLYPTARAPRTPLDAGQTGASAESPRSAIALHPLVR